MPNKKKGMTLSLSELIHLKKTSILTTFSHTINPQNSPLIKPGFGRDFRNKGFTSGIVSAFFSRGLNDEFSQILNRNTTPFSPYNIISLTSIDNGDPYVETTYIADGGFPTSSFLYIVDGNNSRIIYF